MLLAFNPTFGDTEKSRKSQLKRFKALKEHKPEGRLCFLPRE
jgi:hypothetical protein